MNSFAKLYDCQDLPRCFTTPEQRLSAKAEKKLYAVNMNWKKMQIPNFLAENTVTANNRGKNAARKKLQKSL